MVSYFCGCGGLDLGFCGGFNYGGESYKKLPFDIEAAFDNNEKAIETYNHYFAHKADVADVTELTLDDLPKASVLIGGFPCQDFSSCGPLKGLTSARGQLYKELIRYIDKHEPKVVVGENVINLLRIDGGKAVKTIIEDLEHAGPGYRVQVWNMFAPDYGVPQNRQRLFFVGVRSDLEGDPIKPEADFSNKPRSIKWAIGDLEGITDESVPNQSQYFKASKAKKGNGQGDEVNKADEPAYTIRANPKSRVQFHYNLERRLTVRECARIQTFPDDFKFPHSMTTSMFEIGNAVPPVLAYRVASSIADYLDAIVGGD